MRYKLEDYSNRNIYTEMFSLQDLTARGYFMQFMTDLPLEYQWLYLHLQKEIERRQELFPKPKPRKHNRFIKELKATAKKANTTPMKYFKNTFLPYLESKKTFPVLEETIFKLDNISITSFQRLEYVLSLFKTTWIRLTEITVQWK